MPLDVLHEAIIFGMKENLMIQFVYPDYELPQEYKDEIELIDHSKIVPCTLVEKGADVVVYNDISSLKSQDEIHSQSVVLRVSKNQLF